VERHRSKLDKRMVLARLTPAGQQVTNEMYKAMQRAQERLLQPLPPAERKVLISTLLRLIEGNNHLGRTIFTPS
jgi:DNA-binding MarR family transcriptional regulator